MNGFRSSGRRRWLVPAAAAVAFVGGAIAGHEPSGVTSYTGCIASSGSAAGSISKLNAGDSPQQPCSSGQSQIHLSGGDITRVTAGSGLTGGGTNGAVTLSLDTASLPTYSAGTGLDLSGSNQFSVNSNYRLPQGRDPGEAPVRTLIPAWSCGIFAAADQTCPSGQFAHQIDSGGLIGCASPVSGSGSGADVWITQGFDNAPHCTPSCPAEIASLALPTGTYLVHATGFASDDAGGNNMVGVECTLGGGGADDFTNVSAGGGPDIIIGEAAIPFAMSGIASGGSDFSVDVSCQSDDASDHAQVVLTAVRVGTVHTQ